MNMRFHFAACLALVAALPGLAQSYEYGKSGELKGLRKVFIDTGANVAERNHIAEVIEKAKLADLEIIDSVDQAEIVLQFSGGKEEKLSSSQGNLHQNSVRVGSGVVVIRGKDPKKLRLLLSVEATRDKIWKSNPSTKFAKEFISAYKSANGLK